MTDDGGVPPLPPLSAAAARLRLVLCLLTACLAAGPARAGAPLQTEDADVLAAGDCELELAALHLSRPRHAGGAGAGLQCGAGHRLQLGLAFARAHEEDTTSRSGQLGGKLRLGGADDGPRASLAALVGIDQDDGGRWHAARTRVSLVGSLPAGPGTAHVNIGRYRDIPSQLLVTTWGLAYEHGPLPIGGAGTPRWAPMVELFGTRELGSTLNLGLRGTLVEETLFLNLALGQERRRPHTTLASAGLRWAF